MQDPKDLEKKQIGKTDDSWENDQVERGYYYDDAHGYEQFDPECDDETEDDDESDDSDADD